MLEHSLACGSLARAIARTEHLGHRDLESAFAAGLLHDVGALLLAANLPAKYGEVLAAVRRGDGDRIAVERAIFGTSHAAVGAYLVGLWGLPDSIVEAIAYHHRPGDCEGHAVDVLTAVHVANGLVQPLESTPGQGFIDMGYLAKLGAAQRLPQWAELAARGKGANRR
jgi:putative nucleotidyltransferase with HDIG domain